MSRNGTASTISGKISASTACVFTAPSTITQPRSRPSSIAPVSPMKTFAGGKLWTRNPAAAPAVIAASVPAVPRPRSNAMIANAIALIAQTPAASPSIPSEKFTTFITKTRPTTVIGPPASPRLTAPMNGSVMFETSTPAATGIVAATIWPANFTSGCRSKRSSSAPTAVMNVAPQSTPRMRSPMTPSRLRNSRLETQDRGEDRQPAEQRRVARRQAAVARVVDRADARGEARRERREQRRGREGDHEREDRVALRHQVRRRRRGAGRRRAQTAAAALSCAYSG